MSRVKNGKNFTTTENESLLYPIRRLGNAQFGTVYIGNVGFKPVIIKTLARSADLTNRKCFIA